MALQKSGPISASQIAKEFGYSGPNNSISLGNYRISQTIVGDGGINSALSDLSLDNGFDNNGTLIKLIPQSGQITFSNFYNKRLNIIIFPTDKSPRNFNNTIKDKYDKTDSTNVFIVGNFITGRPSPSGKKVWIHVNTTIGSNKSASSANDTKYCSLITGSWPNDTALRIFIGPNGKIVGAGGDGGVGGSVTGVSITANPTKGGNGTSALGVTNVTDNFLLVNKGTIQCGGGGGGGSAAAWGYTHDKRYNADQYSVSGGSGGGGGGGYPAGSGGSGGSASAPYRTTAYTPGNNGSAGGDTSGGKGGDGKGGGNTQGEGVSATGGGGAGGPNGTGGAATSASGNPGNPYPQYGTITSLKGGDGTASSGGTGGRSEGVGAYAHNYFGVNGDASAPSNSGTTGATGGQNGYSIISNINFDLAYGGTIIGNTITGNPV